MVRRAIVVVEIAIALPLLVAAGLGVAGTYKFLNGPQGYDPDGLLTMKLILPDRGYPDDSARRQFVTRTIEAFRQVAGVEQVAAINNMPTSGSSSSRAIEIDGHPPADPNNLPSVDYRTITSEYFSALRIPIVRGRHFSTADREDTQPVVIVSESMARKFWPNEDPIGRRMKLRSGPWLTVVGVSGDVIHDWFNRRNTPALYRPFGQSPSDYLCLVVRTDGEPTAIAPTARRALLNIDPDQPVFDVMTMRRALHERTIGLQYLAAIMATFAAIALLLATVGLYALLTYFVAQRRHEIGIRIALGASARDVVGLAVGQALRMTLTGAAIGLVLAMALSRLMQAGLLGIASGDPRISIGFAAILIAASLVAGYLPARRAATIDPMTALRTE
jgi:ABC-type antimicrobial peptide transport system, permease component